MDRQTHRQHENIIFSHTRAVKSECLFQIYWYVTFLAHLVYQPKSLYNHALSVIVSVTVSVAVGVVCVQSS